MATIRSNATTITIANAGESTLARVAAALGPGQWATLTMGGLSAALLDAGSGRSITEFGARGHWDPVHKRIQFWGQGHYAGSKLITYDDLTNAWTADSTQVFSGIGHAYYHLALDPATGDLYLRGYNSTSVRRKPYGGAWTSISSFADIGRQITGGLEWHAGLNGGRGGLVFIDHRSCQTWNPATNAWTARSSNLTGMGEFHNWIASAGNFVYFGGGNGSTAMYRVSAAGSVEAAASTPLGAGIWAAGGAAPVISHPDGQQLLQFAAGASGPIYRFNGTSWFSHGSHQIGPRQWFAVPISDYGVVVFIAHETSVSAPVAKVYKP
ncbi:MAG: hypothetical protein RMK97_00700 [Sutterellaceae bacterium]|nr:hypothetical protein [Burkholderiaceae bacterium]MDW8429019.1 hypothetical protein [Sutterellaceae bacterium]